MAGRVQGLVLPRGQETGELRGGGGTLVASDPLVGARLCFSVAHRPSPSSSRSESGCLGCGPAFAFCRAGKGVRTCAVGGELGGGEKSPVTPKHSDSVLWDYRWILKLTGQLSEFE